MSLIRCAPLAAFFLSACLTSGSAGIADDPSAGGSTQPAHGEFDSQPAPPPPPATSHVAPLGERQVRQCHMIEGHIRHCEDEPYTGNAPAPQQGAWRWCDLDHGQIATCANPLEGSAIVEQEGVIRECDLVAGVPVSCMDPGYSGDAPVPAPKDAASPAPAPTSSDAATPPAP